MDKPVVRAILGARRGDSVRQKVAVTIPALLARGAGRAHVWGACSIGLALRSTAASTNCRWTHSTAATILLIAWRDR